MVTALPVSTEASHVSTLKTLNQQPQASVQATADVTETHFEEALDVLVPKLNAVGWLGPNGTVPHVAIVCGSGLGSLVDALDKRALTISYADIPHFCPSTVAGHAGQLAFGWIGQVPVAIMIGRLHSYEGWSLRQTTFPITLLGLLGVQRILLTNAAGGLNTRFKKGDLMIVADHINVMGWVGQTPLRGPLLNIDRLRAMQNKAIGRVALPSELLRFPSLNDAYSKILQQYLARAAAAVGLLEAGQPPRCHLGRYVYLSGPTYETPGEVAWLRAAGGDVVGMSTVPEVLAARQLGLEVAVLSLISNEIPQYDSIPSIESLLVDTEENQRAAQRKQEGIAPTHHEVLEATRDHAANVIRLIQLFIQNLKPD